MHATWAEQKISQQEAFKHAEDLQVVRDKEIAALKCRREEIDELVQAMGTYLIVSNKKKGWYKTRESMNT